MAIALPLSTENRTDSNYGSTVFLTNNTDIKKESPTMRDIRSRDENTSSTVTMSSASTKTKSSILRNASTEENHKRRPLKVSFAKMKTVHIVDNLRLCLTREEKSMLWYTSDSSFRQSPTELRLAAAFTHSNRSRNTITKKGRRRRGSRNRSHYNNRSCHHRGSQSHEISRHVQPSDQQQKKSKERSSLRARFGFRKRKSSTKSGSE
mmetsp:Transcript_3526/g.7703  ORF Transcript_3526/g.7703 Transcript_3526/m.7703 type:complete len:207 (-) Transcript_3526:105-725(-)